MTLKITLVTGERYAVDVGDDDERARMKEILDKGGPWVQIGTDSWVRRDAIVKVDITTRGRAAGFN